MPAVQGDLHFAGGSETNIRGPPIDVAELAHAIADAIQTTSERDHFVTGRGMTIAESRMLMKLDAKTSLRSDECFACSAQTITSRDQSP